jgi:hypothetical protein
MLELGAVFMRTETELILKSRRVVPARLLERGFRFKFPMWQDAASDLVEAWQLSRRAARAADGRAQAQPHESATAKSR